MIIAMGFALFGAAVKYLQIFPEESHSEKQRLGVEATRCFYTGAGPCRRRLRVATPLLKRLTHSISAKLVGSLLAAMLVISLSSGTSISACTASIWNRHPEQRRTRQRRDQAQTQPITCCATIAKDCTMNSHHRLTNRAWSGARISIQGRDQLFHRRRRSESCPR